MQPHSLMPVFLDLILMVQVQDQRETLLTMKIQKTVQRMKKLEKQRKQAMLINIPTGLRNHDTLLIYETKRTFVPLA